jgi:hypothetical protein
MKNALSSILILCCFSNAAIAQQVNSAASEDDIRLSKGHPAIYITFERRGTAVDPMTSPLAETGKPVSRSTGGQDYWLRIHNNSRWAILFQTWSLYLGESVSPMRLSDGRSVLGLNDDIEVNAVYRVEESDGRVVPYGGDSYSESWLPPGRSVVFSVDRGHLANDRSIYIYYSYEWEFGHAYSYNLAPEHRVMYWGYRLQNEDR